MEFEKLKKVIADVLNVDPDEIGMDSTFVDDLGADSLDVFQIVMGIEEEFDIEIPAEEAEKIHTKSYRKGSSGFDQRHAGLKQALLYGLYKSSPLRGCSFACMFRIFLPGKEDETCWKITQKDIPWMCWRSASDTGSGTGVCCGRP